MDTHKFYVLLAVCRLGSYTAAARELGYSTSGVARMMESLNEEMGFPLLTSVPQGMRLTEEGRALLPEIRRLVAAGSQIREKRDEIKGLITGTLNIGSYSSTAARWLPPILHEYVGKYPGVSVHLEEGSNQLLVDGLRGGTLSCAFLRKPSHYEGDWIPLKEDRLLLWIPSGWKLAAEKAVRPKELDGVPFINPLPHLDTDTEALLHKYHVHPDYRLTTKSNYTCWCLVAAGLGVSINNELMSLGWKGPVTVRPFLPNETISLGMALPSLKEASPALKAFIACTKSFLSSFSTGPAAY